MKDKKVAIMTWHSYNNYGGVLQAYALQYIIKQLSYKQVDMINYMPKAPRKNTKTRITTKAIKRKILFTKKQIKKNLEEKEEKFNKFRKDNFTYTEKCNDATELFLLNDKYDKFICGSDQIWAPTVYDENYFLNFVTDSSKKISYAPSMGLTSIDNQYIKENIKKLINQIDCISVREEQGKKILQELTNKNIEVVLDPTLLLKKEQWNNLFDLEKNKEDDYIVFYCLEENRRYYRIAKSIARKLNKNLKVIPGDILDYKKSSVQNVSPNEFLKLIYNASMVITDSFHGTIFSINFNVPFMTLRRFKDDKFSQNSRIYNILKIVHLEERIYNNNIDYFIKNKTIDFSRCNEIIDKERVASLEFLRKSLEKNNKNSYSSVITNICAGCGLCATLCPKQCITIKLNDQGFYYYEIDENKCIKCNKCKMICGQVNKEIEEIKNMKLYSVHSLDDNVLNTSSSGGMAYEISLYGIQNNMPVIGCTYNIKENRAEHIKITKQEEICKLSGSKYLQSYTVNAFKELERMNKGIVIGTPCQIGSIDRYLKQIKKRESFILVDLICNGVPSYNVWKKYISNYKKIENVKFRDKRYGWRSKNMSINLKCQKKEQKNLFYDLFRTKVAFNKSCYECKYRIKTSADIRIGDYWGDKFKDVKKGISMVIINTKNGQELVKNLIEKDRIKAKEEPIDDYFKAQQTFNDSMPLLYDQIESELKDENYSLKRISKKYCKNELRYDKLKCIIFRIKNKIKEK